MMPPFFGDNNIMFATALSHLIMSGREMGIKGNNQRVSDLHGDVLFIDFFSSYLVVSMNFSRGG